MKMSKTRKLSLRRETIKALTLPKEVHKGGDGTGIRALTNHCYPTASCGGCADHL